MRCTYANAKSRNIHFSEKLPPPCANFPNLAQVKNQLICPFGLGRISPMITSANNVGQSSSYGEGAFNSSCRTTRQGTPSAGGIPTYDSVSLLPTEPRPRRTRRRSCRMDGKLATFGEPPSLPTADSEAAASVRPSGSAVGESTDARIRTCLHLIHKYA